MSKQNKAGQSDYLKACIRDSYFLLLQEKTPEAITVSEIVKLAGLSRMSFYRYYQVKEDIVRQYIEDSFNEFLDAVNITKTKDPEIAATLFFGYFRANKTKIKILIEKDLFHLLFETFSQFIQASNIAIDANPKIPQQNLKYYYQYISGGILNLIKTWASTEMLETDEQMAELLKQIKLAQGLRYQ